MWKTKTILFFIILLCMGTLTGCWNYKEVESLAIVAGAAVDKGDNSRYRLTVEIVKITGGRDSKPESMIVTTEGNSMFDCARNAISITGKRLYWSHNKFLIVSKDIAKDGVVDMIDWFNRNAETRTNIHLFISTEKTAAEIFSGEQITEAIRAFELDNMLKNEDYLSKAPMSEIETFGNNMRGQGISASVATIKMKATEKDKTPSIGGTALFSGDKLIGFLNEEETKELLFVKNEIKGGLLIQEVQTKLSNDENKKTNIIPITFEIFKSKTKLKPVFSNNDISFDLKIETVVSLAEIGGEIDLISEKGRRELIELAETSCEKRIQNIIKKVQREYGVDVFGFGKNLSENNTKVWKRVKNNWEEYFKKVKVDVTFKIDMKGSSLLSKPLEVGR